APALAACREVLLGRVLEPLLARAPGRVTEAQVDAIATVFRECPRLGYAIDAIAQRPQASPPVRRRAAELTGRAFPERAAAGRIFGRRPFHLLVAHNVRIGQGDEIVRLVPLLQALLDAHPHVRATIITSRPYLYDHPSIRAIAIGDAAAVSDVLAATYQ